MKLKVTLLLLFFYLLSSQTIFAQDKFQVTALAHQESILEDAKQSLNGGSILFGRSTQNNLSFLEIQKLFPDYSVEWNKSYLGSDSSIYPAATYETADGKIYCTGQIVQSGNPTDPASDILLFKTDDLGNLIWGQRIDHYYSDLPTSFLCLGDGSIFIVSQVSNSSISPSYNISIIRCDSLGNALWSKSVGGSSNEVPAKISSTIDEQICISGTSTSFSIGAAFFLSKFDTSGNNIWFKTYFTANADSCFGHIQTNDGGYILYGKGGINADDILIIKTDSDGVMQSSHSYNLGFGSNSNIDVALDVIQSTDGGFIIAGETQVSTSLLPFIFIIKTDPNLSSEWHNTFGFQIKNDFASILNSADNGFVICGSRTLPFTSTMRDLLIKTDSSANTACLQTVVDLVENAENPFSSSVSPTSLNTLTNQIPYSLNSSAANFINDTSCYISTSVDERSALSEIKVFPNPVNDKIILAFKDNTHQKDIEICLYDRLGRNVFHATKTKSQFSSTIDIDLPAISSGIYFINILSEDEIIYKHKIICNH